MRRSCGYCPGAIATGRVCPLPSDPVFYIARNTLPFTRNMSKRAALALWEANKSTQAADGALYQLCRDTGSVNPVVVMDLA